MMTCDELRAALEGGFNDAGCAEHLRHCAECAAHAAHLPVENAALQALLGADVDEASFQRVRAWTSARITRDKRPSRQIRKLPSARLTPASARKPWLLAIAALAALTLLGLFAGSQMQSKPDEVASPTPKDGPPDSGKPHGPAGTPGSGTGAGAVAVQPPQSSEPVAPVDPEKSLLADIGLHKPAVPRAVVNKRLTQLQAKLRTQNALDDVEQLSIALADSKEFEAKSTTDDAELHLERLLLLDNLDSDEAVVEMRVCKDVAAQMREIQDALNDDAPDDFKTSLKRTIAAFDDGAALAATLPEFEPTHPGAIDAATALVAKAEERLKNAEYADALTVYKTFITQYPKDRRVLQARYTSAFILQKKLSNSDDARKLYQALAEMPDHRLVADQALYHLGQAYEGSGDASKALAAYQKLKTKDAHVGATLNDKVSFLDNKVKGVQVPKPGWAARVIQGSALMKPRPAGKKPVRTLPK